MRAPAPSTAVNNRLGYRTRNGKLKCLEPHFQLSATGSDSKEVMQSAVALPHSRECTKEATPVLPNNGSKVKFGATAELRNIVQEKKRGKGASGCRFDCLQNFVLWAMQHRWVWYKICSTPTCLGRITCCSLRDFGASREKRGDSATLVTACLIVLVQYSN